MNLDFPDTFYDRKILYPLQLTGLSGPYTSTAICMPLTH